MCIHTNINFEYEIHMIYKRSSVFNLHCHVNANAILGSSTNLVSSRVDFQLCPLRYKEIFVLFSKSLTSPDNHIVLLLVKLHGYGIVTTRLNAHSKWQVRHG